MAAQAKTPLPGYRDLWGVKQTYIADVNGPTSYANGTGQLINATDVGMGGFDWVDVGFMSHSGTYYCRVQYLPTSPNPSTVRSSVKQIQVRWFVIATNAEVANAVNLSGEIQRMMFVGV